MLRGLGGFSLIKSLSAERGHLDGSLGAKMPPHRCMKQHASEMSGSSDILSLVFDGVEYPPPPIAVRNTINRIPKDLL